MKQLTVVRVTETEFELNNGAVYPHMIPLEVVPTIEEFQMTYDHICRLFEEQGLTANETASQYQ